jgi:hypothetical protein
MLRNTHVSITNLFIQLNQRLNNCKLTQSRKVSYNETLQREYICRIMCKNFCSEFPVQDSGLSDPARLLTNQIACFTVVII